MTIDYNHARELMVEQQIRPWDVLEMRVLNVLAELPREAFVADAHKALAYSDVELPLANGQKMFKPVIEGRTLQALNIQDGEAVLEIGAGSGFLAACLGQLGREVVSLEIDPAQAAIARANLDAARLGDNVRIETADALTWDTEQRFDAICVSAATTTVPTAFAKWLRPGGRLFVIHGQDPVMEAVLVDTNGKISSQFETLVDYLRGAEPVEQFTL